MTEKYWTGDSLNAEKEALLGAVIGLCRAAESNMHRVSQNTDDILIKALCTLGAEDEKEMGLITDRVKKEKQRLAPGCAGCGSPCGRTEEEVLHCGVQTGKICCIMMSMPQPKGFPAGGRRKNSKAWGNFFGT